MQMSTVNTTSSQSHTPFFDGNYGCIRYFEATRSQFFYKKILLQSNFWDNVRVPGRALTNASRQVIKACTTACCNPAIHYVCIGPTGLGIILPGTWYHTATLSLLCFSMTQGLYTLDYWYQVHTRYILLLYLFGAHMYFI